MLFIVIAAVLVAFSYEPPSELGQITRPTVALTALAAFIVVNWVFGTWVARWTTRRLTALGNRTPVLQRYQRLRWLHAGALLGSYTALIHAFDWPGVVRVWWGFDRWVIVDDLLVLFPVVVTLVLGILAHFRVEELLRLQSETPHVHPPHWKSRWSHVDFHVRHHLGIVLMPLLMLVAIQDIVSLAFADAPAKSAIEFGAALAGLAGILIFAPLLLRVLWQSQPLPAGPLRTRLEELSRRLKFRTSNILVWNTHGAVINAAVAGILPWPRYVLLSDALLTHLSQDEVAAVFGHEIGHVRHHHLWFFMAFLAGAMSFLAMSVSALSPMLESLVGTAALSQVFGIAQGLVLPLACLAVYFGLFFGFLSRRFERQADIFGCRAVSCGHVDCPVQHEPTYTGAGDPPLCPAGIQVFVQALERIADLNGAMRDARSWRHFSIAKRVEFLRRIAERPQVERSFQRVVFLLKILVLVGLIGGAWYLWQASPESARVVLSR